jgi:hypothetical protein
MLKKVAAGSSQLVREAVLKAAVELGMDGRGTGGLVGWLKRLAITEPASFAALVAKSVPPMSAQAPAHGYAEFDPTKELAARIVGLAARLAPARHPPDAEADGQRALPGPDTIADAVSVVIDGANGQPTAVAADPSAAKLVEPLVALHVPAHAEAIVIGPATGRTYAVEGAAWDRITRVVEPDARAFMGAPIGRV